MDIYKNVSLNDLPNERWLPLPICDRYHCSNLGRIKAIPRVKTNAFGSFTIKERIIKQTLDKKFGYLSASICFNDGSMRNIKIHRLIATTFIENKQSRPQVNHKNGCKTDNRVSNLEWATSSQNMKHAYNIGVQNKEGERHHFAKLNNESVLGIRRMHKSGLLQKYIAAKFGVSIQTINGIVKGRTWSHIL